MIDNIYDILLILLYVIILSIIYYIIYYWIISLENIGCECSKDWRRDFIKLYVVFSISYTYISAFYLIFIGKNIDIAFAVKLFILLFDIFFIYNTFNYINKLKIEKCECSNNISRDIVLFYSIILGSLIALSISISIFILLSFYISNKYKNYFSSSFMSTS
jgi:hypothetical protein